MFKLGNREYNSAEDVCTKLGVVSPKQLEEVQKLQQTLCVIPGYKCTVNVKDIIHQVKIIVDRSTIEFPTHDLKCITTATSIYYSSGKVDQEFIQTNPNITTLDLASCDISDAVSGILNLKFRPLKTIQFSDENHHGNYPQPQLVIRTNNVVALNENANVFSSEVFKQFKSVQFQVNCLQNTSLLDKVCQNLQSVQYIHIPRITNYTPQLQHWIRYRAMQFDCASYESTEIKDMIMKDYRKVLVYRQSGFFHVLKHVTELNRDLKRMLFDFLF